MLPTPAVEPLNPHAHWRPSHGWYCLFLGPGSALLGNGEGISCEVELILVDAERMSCEVTPIPVDVDGTSCEVEPVLIDVDGIRCKVELLPVDGMDTSSREFISLHKGHTTVEVCCIRS